MHMTLKSSLMTMLLAGAAAMTSTAGTAGVSVSVGIGAPFYAPGPGYSPYEGQVYYDPIYFGGAWYHGPYRWRVVHGERVYWVGGRWHRNEWRGRPIPASLAFRNGGYFRAGRYDGFEGADRINTRFHADRAMDRGERADMRSDRADMRQGRDRMQDDRGAMRDRRDGPQGEGEMHDRQDHQGQPRQDDSGPPHN